MAIEQSIVNLIIESIDDRYISLGKELSRLKEKRFPSLGPGKLLDFIQRANERIHTHVSKVVQDKETLCLLTEEQIEVSLYRYSKLIPYLHVLLSFVKGAEIKDTPVSLIKPLKRLINRFLPNAEVIFLSSPVFNYSFFELAGPIRKVFSEYFEGLLETSPEYLMVITFPESEMKNTLLHCIIGHEIGHGLYQESELSEKLKKSVYDSINKEELDKTIKFLSGMLQAKEEKDKTQPSLFPTELQVKEMIASATNEIIDNWVEELSSDGFGICILGPAFYFSFIHFIISCHYINDISSTHPSPKLRILFMSQCLQDKNLGLHRSFDSKMEDFFEVWEKIARSPSYLGDPILKLILDAINKNLDLIRKEIIKSLGNKLLTNKQLENLPILVDMIIDIIPPNEIIDFDNGNTINSDITSILNAGWATYISKFEEFSENVKKNSKDTGRYEIKKRLNELLLKAIELCEIKNIAEERL